jgi:PAS domain S-box-containing protein
MRVSRTVGVIVTAVLAAIVVALPLDPRPHGLAVAGATLLGSIWVGIGLGRHDLPRRLLYLLGAATVTNLVFVTAWVIPVVVGRSTQLAEPSHADPGLVLATALLATVLIVAMTRRERALTVLLDLASIAVAAGLVLGSLLARGQMDRDFPATEMAYVAADVVLIACVLRVLLTPRRRPLALWLLAGAGLAMAATDILRNQMLLHTAPGAWADLGWGAAALLLGLAVLHPSMRRIGGSEPLGHDLRSTSALVLGLTSLIAPLVLSMHSFTDAFGDIDGDRELTLAVLACGVLLATLVVVRFMLLLRRARALTDAATSALAERDRMLERSEVRYQRLVEEVPAVVILFRLGPHPPLPVYVSPQSERMLGVTPEQWLADPEAISARIHPEDLEHLITELARREQGATIAHPEFRFTRPDGAEVWVRDVSGVITEEADCRYLQAMLVDITEYKRSELERKQMEHELQLSQKLEAVGQLAAGIAHEINTPIQFVGDTFAFLQDAFSDLLALSEIHIELRQAAETRTVAPELLERAREAEDFADLEYLSERVPAAVARGVDGVSRVAAIVRAMRDFAHPPTLEKYPVDVASTVHDALIVAMNAYKYVAEVETDIDALPDVMCNGGEISQVFLNLIVNAAHAIEGVVGDSGRLGKITVRAERDGDHVIVSIADTGGGIPDEVAARVFDPFFTTKEVGRGTGQGLALARTMIVERHGGTLTFDTEPGAGTTFHVRLPIGAEMALLETA